jgi:flagellar motor switch protein FliN/FliY
VTSSAAASPDTRPTPNAPSPKKRDPNIARILELGVPVSVILAERPMPVETILLITVGTILEFDVPFGSDLSLVVGNRTLGRGQAVKIGEHFGLRITEIDSVRHRIEAMGPEDAIR